MIHVFFVVVARTNGGLNTTVTAWRNNISWRAKLLRHFSDDHVNKRCVIGDLQLFADNPFFGQTSTHHSRASQASQSHSEGLSVVLDESYKLDSLGWLKFPALMIFTWEELWLAKG